MELHAIVVRERPHELIRQDAKAALMKGDEAHDVAITRPWLWLAVQSNPLWPGGVYRWAKESTVDKRLKHLLGDVQWIPRVRLDNDDVAGHECGGGFE